MGARDVGNAEGRVPQEECGTGGREGVPGTEVGTGSDTPNPETPGMVN